MPPEWNTRSTMDVPELFVCGLLHVAKRSTWAGSAAFSRAMLSNSSRLSSGERPGPPRNGLTWACAAVMEIQAASAADKQCGDRGRIHVSFKAVGKCRLGYLGPEPTINYYFSQFTTGRAIGYGIRPPSLFKRVRRLRRGAGRLLGASIVGGRESLRFFRV